MNIDESTFWNLLTASGLVSASEAEDLRRRFHAANPSPSAPHGESPSSVGETVSNWLIEQKVLSPFQAAILAKGVPGPFNYGNYTVEGRIEAGPMSGMFLAVHRPTGHPVVIQFFSGSTPDDLERWRSVQHRAEKFSELDSTFLLPVHEAVVLPKFRFVVCERPVGKSLFERVPWKSRLPWQDALQIVAATADALHELEQRSLAHGQLSTQTVHWSTRSHAVLRPTFGDPDLVDSWTSGDKVSGDKATEPTECAADYLSPESAANAVPPTIRSDVYSLGVVLYRLVSGRVPHHDRPPDQRLEARSQGVEIAWDKYQVPVEVQTLARAMLNPSADQRPSPTSILQAIDAVLPGQSYAKQSPAKPPTFTPFREQLRRFQPGHEAVPSVTEAPAVSVPRTISDPDTLRKPIQPTRRPKWVMPVSIAAALLILAGLLGGFAWYANQQTFVAHVPAGGEPSDAPLDDGSASNADDPNSPTDNPDNATATRESGQVGRYLQTLVEDDGDTLWQTPTGGPPVDFSSLPPAPRIILVWRPRDLTATEDGRLLIQAFGPRLNALLESWRTRTGLNWNEIDEIVMSLHTVDFQYRPVFRVTLTQSLEKQRLVEMWQTTGQLETEEGHRLFTNDDGTAWHFIDAADALDAFTASRFIMGPEALVREAANLAGATTLTGALADLASQTDRDRQLNFLFLRQSLFNDEGQKLMSGKAAAFNRALDLALHDSIRGGLLSLHLDEGTYLEMRWATTLDLKPAELRDWLDDSLRQQRDRLMEFVAGLPPNPYWDRVRARFGGMLADLYRHLRTGIERDKVIANAWLPPMAAHNLVASAELLIHFADSASPVTTTPVDTTPASIEDLLRRPRDLKVTTNPDLNILLADLEAEILDEYGKLPFPFHIKILGNDLLIEGITKNQRPGEFDLKQTPLADILTEIMVRANPSKDISGPSDPNCKLVWALGPDPDNPDQRIVLVTTRNAVERRGYDLPDAFRAD